MNYDKYKELILKQAEEKGWGHTKEMLDVAEKTSLIHCEIDELHDAYKGRNKKSEKDSLGAEMSDVLLRSLHLGGAWGVNFNKLQYKTRIRKDQDFSQALLYFHDITSKAYDYYRHKNNALFLKKLNVLAHEVYEFSKLLNFDIEKEILRKMDINTKRTWSSKKLAGRYYKE